MSPHIVSLSVELVSFVVVLGILIFVHELGHFIVAKMLGVGVEKFSLGFGPRILGRKVGMTDYRISAIPLGGYVKMVGETPDAELDAAMTPLSFSHKSLLRRSLIVLAGPAFNLLLAVMIFFGYAQILGLRIMEPEVGEVQEEMPAHKAGMRSGDRILAVDGNPVTRWDEMSGLINDSGGRALTFELMRNKTIVSVSVVPKLVTAQNLFGESIDKYIVGITASGAFRTERLNPIEALAQGVSDTWQWMKLTVLAIGKIITGTLSTKNLGGPIMIAQLAGDYAEAGLTSLVLFIAVLSVNLGILNLLPIPVLDGGHLLFFLIEGVSRRPVNLKMREVAQQVGLFVLILLMTYVIYNDISRRFFE